MGDRRGFTSANAALDGISVVGNVGFELRGGAISKESCKVRWKIYVCPRGFNVRLKAKKVLDRLAEFVAFGAL